MSTKCNFMSTTPRFVIYKKLPRLWGLICSTPLQSPGGWSQSSPEIRALVSEGGYNKVSQSEWLKQQELTISINSGGQKSQIKVLVGFVPSEGCGDDCSTPVP